jgi:hypothetical protein
VRGVRPLVILERAGEGFSTGAVEAFLGPTCWLFQSRPLVWFSGLGS